MEKKNYSNIGKYERIRLLGIGAFGAVYECYDRALQQLRAVKVIESKTPNDLLTALNEARIQEVCEHDYVVEIKEADITTVDGKKVVIVVTELMPGGSALDEMTRGWVTAKRACSVVADALLGLEHLHVNHVCHCDIKPGNILFTDYKKAKLSDFGLANRLSMGDVISAIYTLHAPPEYYPGMRSTIAADIYSMGVTLYRLLYNIPDLLVHAADTTTVWQRIKEGKFPHRNMPNRAIPAAIFRIANRAMHIDPSKRFPSASKMAERIKQLKWYIEWRIVDEYNYTGNFDGVDFTLSILEEKSMWSVEFRRMGRRSLEYCTYGLKTAIQAKHQASKVLRETTLRN